MNIKTRALTGAAAAIVVVGGVLAGAGIASAQEPSTTPTHRQQVRASFLSHLAANLGTTEDQLKAAVKSAELQTVDDLVNDGTITPDQGAKIKERINNSDGLGLGQFFRRHYEAIERMQRIRRGIGRSAAGAIGIDLKTLAGELRGGKSIADVAGEHNVSVDDVKSAITADATKALDKARENGRIDQAKEDAALQKLSDSLDKIVNKKRDAA